MMVHTGAGELDDAGRTTLALLREASALSRLAAEALDAGDADEVLRLLEERGEIFRSCEPALALLRDAREADPGSRVELARCLANIESASREIEESDSRLSIALRSERDRIGRDLDQVDGDEMIRSAYGKQTRERARINITR